MNTFGERLMALRNTLELSVTDMAKSLHFQKSSISRYERNITKPSIELLKAILKTYNANINWLLDDRGEMFLQSNEDTIALEKALDNSMLERWSTASDLCRFTEIDIHNEDCISLPVYGEIAAGEPVAVIDNDPISQTQVPKRFLDRTPDDWYVFRINGKSMTPQIQHEDLVFIKRNSDWHQMNKRIVAVRINGEITLKKLNLKPAEGLVEFVAFNPDYKTIVIRSDDLDDVALIGEMKSLRRIYKPSVN